MPHVVNRRFLCSKSTYLYVIVGCFVIGITARSCTRHRLLQKHDTLIRPLIFLVVLFPEDNLTYQPLPCNSIRTFFLDYIRLYDEIFSIGCLSCFDTCVHCKSDMVDNFLQQVLWQSFECPIWTFLDINSKTILYISFIFQRIIFKTTI